jgi:hypothetical protein
MYTLIKKSVKHSCASMVFAAVFSLTGLVDLAHAASATDIDGLYYTGVNSTEGLLNGDSQDSHWSVTYASTNGGSSANTTYKGAAYVVDSATNNAGHTNDIDSGWVQNTSNAQWIIPPGASTAATGGTTNAGGVYLPGNGGTGAAGQPNNTADTNEGVYVYTLAFNVTGSGTTGSTVSNVVLTLTAAADDQFSVYVNPTGNGASIPTGTASFSATNAWSNTTSVTLNSSNSTFKIGTNYLVFVVDNTNSVTGNSGSTALNPSGLLVYQIYGYVNGQVVPEVGTWMPVVGAVGLYGMVAWRRSRRRSSLSV